MDLEVLLSNLNGEKKVKFLEQFTRSPKLLINDNFEIAFSEAKKISPLLAVSYLRAKGHVVKALMLLEKSELHAEAAKLCVELNLKEQALRNYLKDNNLEEAFKLCEEFNKLKAAEILEDLKGPGDAANYLFRLSRETDNNTEIMHACAEAYKRDKSFHSAGSCFYQAGNLESALESYKKVSCNQRVTEILEELGREDELVQYWLDNNNDSSLAAHFEENNEFESAIVHYKKLHDYSSAARCLLKENKILEALWLLQITNSYQDCVDLADNLNPNLITLQMHGLINKCHDKLGASYEAKNPKRALDHYIASANNDKTVELASALLETEITAGNFSAAKEYAIIAGDLDKAEIYNAAQDLLS